MHYILSLGAILLFLACGSPKSKHVLTKDQSFGEVIILLDKNTSIKALEEKYSDLHLKQIEKLSPSMEMYLCRFNNLSTDSLQFINDLKASNGVVNVQFNHKTKPRSN